jgi:hypothetical protein
MPTDALLRQFAAVMFVDGIALHLVAPCQLAIGQCTGSHRRIDRLDPFKVSEALRRRPWQLGVGLI